MLFFYVRHGDPIYSPDSLTPLGERQAEAVGKRLARHGLNKIYASTSNRARLTAQPACEMLKIDMELLDFANEGHAWHDMCWVLDKETQKKTWVFDVPENRRLSCDPELVALGHKWYEHPRFSEYNYKKGINRVRDASDELFLSLGYEHIRETGAYKAIRPNNDRIALFAHAGFGALFLSAVLDMPYPHVAVHFEMQHSGLTVIEFPDNGEGLSVPRILTFSNDSHIYGEGLPTNFNNRIRF